MNNNLYCLITGASEGFGRALALECASRKMNLVLVALAGPELNFLADFIRRNYGVEVVALAADLCSEEQCNQLYQTICDRNLPVNMLINNAGLGSTMLFGEGNIAFYQKQVQLNVMATTLLTRLFLEILKANAPSYILNVGSLSCFFALPKKQVYGATKSFIYSFSRSLCAELKEDRVHVSVICPGGMNTNNSVTLLARSSGFISKMSIMNPEEVAGIAISGLLNRKEVILSGRLNRTFLLLNALLPGCIKNMITNRHMRNLASVTSPGTNQSSLHLVQKLNLARQ
ncbi:MAG: SDR family NAD(P)-dependent oxidoreductase [Bacteroidota bacterium]